MWICAEHQATLRLLNEQTNDQQIETRETIMTLPILIVDDNPDACEMAARMIQLGGNYQTETACDGPAALELVKAHPFALAIIDYAMPGMNGVELFRKMREVRPDMKGIFLTGFTTIDVVFPAIDAGILRVLAKPIDFDELMPVIEQYSGTAA
jgi:DNA-binding NtrC family response regulator